MDRERDRQEFITHHIEVDEVSLVRWASVQRAVLPSVLFPGAMEIIGHHMEVVQHSDKDKLKLSPQHS